jgi:hypothetical protein
MSFPELTEAPWIERARVHGTIIVAHGPLRLGRSPIGFSDVAVEHGKILAAAIPFWVESRSLPPKRALRPEEVPAPGTREAGTARSFLAPFSRPGNSACRLF